MVRYCEEKTAGIITSIKGSLVATPRANIRPQDNGQLILFSLSLVPRIAINTPNEVIMILGDRTSK